jgi:PAS domain S-box-containing protein
VPGSRRRTLSLESKLPLMVGSVLLIVITALALASYTLGTDAERSSASIRLEREASMIATELHGGTRGILLHGQGAAADSRVHAYLRSPDTLTQTAAEDTLRYTGPRPELVLAVELFDAGGRRLIALGPAHASSPRLSPAELTAAEFSGIGAVYAINTLPAFPAVASVRVDDQRLGWVVVWWHLDLTLVSDQGVVYVGSPQNQVWMNRTGIVAPPEGDVTSGVMPLRYERDGRTQLAGTAAVAETPWFVLIEADDAVMLAPTRRFLARVAALAFGVFVLACVAAWVMSRRLTAPLRRLTDAAAAISAGDYSSRAGLTGDDEIGRLAGAFDHMAARVQSSHEALRAIVDEAPVAVYSLDADGIVRSWNPAAERIFGWSADEAIGQPLQTVPGDVRMTPSERVQEVASGRLVKGVELTRLRKDGSTVTVRVHAGPMHDSTGKVSGIMVVATDTTELRRLEHQYRHAQKMEAVGRLAGGIAHDFNNLLTVILGETEMALQDLDAADPSRLALEEIGKAGHRAGQLTRQLLSFSRQQIVESTVFDLTELVKDVERMLDRLIGEDVQLQSRLADEVMPVRADRSQIEQLLINLAVNARDAMPDGGLLSLELTSLRLGDSDALSHAALAPGDYCVLSVNDSGVGMSEEVRAHIFEPFFTTKGPGRGTGLGLATCYGIVSQAGGHIEVYSEPGVGSSFKVYLPKASDGEVSGVHTPVQDTSVGNEHILLVEDQAAVRDIATRMLTSLGYQVTTAEDGETALDILRQVHVKIDLLLTDVVLTGMNGGDLAERARALVPGLKVLFASGYTGDVAAYQALVDASSNLIQKPFTMSALGERVRQALDQ